MPSYGAGYGAGYGAPAQLDPNAIQTQKTQALSALQNQAHGTLEGLTRQLETQKTMVRAQADQATAQITQQIASKRDTDLMALDQQFLQQKMALEQSQAYQAMSVEQTSMSLTAQAQQQQLQQELYQKQMEMQRNMQTMGSYVPAPGAMH
jgi:hypothetical protein